MKLSIRSGIREFNEGQKVMVRDYRNAGRSWIPAEIQSRSGPLYYTVYTGHGTFWRRHADQLRFGTTDPDIILDIPSPELSVP